MNLGMDGYSNNVYKSDAYGLQFSQKSYEIFFKPRRPGFFYPATCIILC